MVSTYEQKAGERVRDVLIVYPYTYQNPYLCLPPLAAEYLHAGVLEAGCNATLLDMRFEDDVREQIEQADLVCLYGFFEDCAIFGKWGVHVIDEVMAQIPADTPIAAGGTGFGNAVETLEKYPRIDVVIEGVANIPAKALMEAGSPRDIPNLAWRRGDEIVRNQKVSHPLSEDVYPRRSLRNPRYEYHVLGIKIDLVRAAMGCDYKCRFCYQYGKDTDGQYLRWNGRSAQSQFNELAEIDAPFVLWVDDDMTTDMEELDKLADLLIASDVRKVLIGTGRVDHVVKSDVSVLKKLERAGFLALAFGVESLDDEMLRFYRKAQKVAQAEKAMGMMSKTNILLFCNFLLGSPGETEADMMEFLWFGGRHRVDTLVTNRLRVPEKSDLYPMIYDENGEVKPGMEMIRGRERKRIKNKIKFGQYTPWRFLNSMTKLYRHRGLTIDPLYLVCKAILGATRHSWIGKTKILDVLFFLPMLIARIPGFRHLTRAIAWVMTPLVWLIYTVSEWIERRVRVFSQIMPWFFGLFSSKKHKRRAQAVAGRAISVGGAAK